MIELLGGFVLGGAAGFIAKDKIAGTSQKNNKAQQEIDTLCNENDKLRRRNKDLERQVEDLLSELKKARRASEKNDDRSDDLEDELDDAKRELRSLRQQNDELARRVKEYKTACETQEAEINMLKEKL